MDPSVFQAFSSDAFVYYFPHGHAEQATSPPVFGSVCPMVLARIVAVQLLADPDTDEVFAKIKLYPFGGSDAGAVAVADDGGSKAQFSVKNLTSAVAKWETDLDKPARRQWEADFVHDSIFRDIFDGKPLRPRLRAGWSNLVKKKKLFAGDSMVFICRPAGKMCAGVLRTSILRTRRPFQSTNGMLSPESVANAAKLATDGKDFEVTHYPKTGRAEFVVSMEVVDNAFAEAKRRWKVGTEFNYAWDLEDPAGATYHHGSIDAIIDSAWRMIQVKWVNQEQETLQLPTRINPWEVVASSQSVSNSFPTTMVSCRPLPLSSYPKARKKRRSASTTPSKSTAATPRPNFSEQLKVGRCQPLTSDKDVSLDLNLSLYGMQGAKSVHPATKFLMLGSQSQPPADDLSLELKLSCSETQGDWHDDHSSEPFIINEARPVKFRRVVPPETYSFTLNGELIYPIQPEEGAKLDAAGDEDRC